MPKFTKTDCYGRMNGRTDPNYRVASLLKRKKSFSSSKGWSLSGYTDMSTSLKRFLQIHFTFSRER